MYRKSFPLFFPTFLCLLLFEAKAQEVATLELNIPRGEIVSGIPISAELDPISHIADSLLALVEINDGQEKPVGFQIENDATRRLVWLVEPDSSSDERVYKLINRKAAARSSGMRAKIKDGGIILGTQNQDLLRYNYATIFPPRGVDEVFKRSGFIHPLWSLAGRELTRMQPPDHYHHYGIWNPWTRVEYKGKSVDFWNLGEKQGTVRFANFISRTAGPVYSEFEVLHEHVVFDGAGEEVALHEVQGVRIYQPDSLQDAYIADISIELNCATEHPVTLKEYRYGGLGWRATEKWHKDNSEVITSEGKNRVEADGSLARWCIVQGEIDEGYSAVLMMSFPTNYNHPEPLRIWPEDIYDRGDMFANFSPTKNIDWKLEPGKNYQLKYRFYVSDQKITSEEAEKLWQQFAYPPEIKVVR